MYRKKIERGLFFTFMVGFMIQHAVVTFAQAPSYSKEAVAARERDVETEGIVMKDDRLQSRIGSEMLMSGERSIGNARSNVRGGGGGNYNSSGGGSSSGGGQSAMLRFDQHREVQPPAHPTIRLGSWYADIGIGQSIGVQYIRMEGSGVGFNTQNGRGQYLKDGFDIPLVSTLYLNNYVMISRRMDFSFNINVSYAYYPFKTQEDTLYVDMSDEGIFATFSSEFELTRDLKLLIYDDILYQTDYIDTRGLEDFYGGQQYEHLENTIGADLDWRLARRDNISLSGSRRDVISFDEEFDDQEGVFYSELISYQHELTRFAVVGLFGTAEQSLYNLDTRENVNIYGVGAFASAQLTRTLFGSASLGYDFSVYPDSDDSTRDGSLSGSLGLGHQISEGKYQSLYYDRTQREAFRGGVDVTDELSYRYNWDSRNLPGSFTTRYSLYTPTDDSRGSYTDWDSSLSMRYQMTRRWTLNFGTSYAIRLNNPTENEIGSGTPDTSSDYATWTIRVGTGRPVTKKTRFTVYAEHADRTSDNEDMVYTQDSIVASLDWTHKF